VKQIYFTNIEGTVSKESDFIGNFVYENGVPAYNVYDEGRIVYNTDGTYFGEAFIKDHLGNVRVTCRMDHGQVRVRQVDSYYPFGMNIKELSQNSTDKVKPNEYLYNGKMMQDEMGLGWLDYGARFYDAVLGRWHTSDPRAEKYYSWSPYSYCYNNPLNFIDPQGDTVKFAGNAEKTAYDTYKNEVNSSVEAYDKRTQKLRDKGKTERADERDANRASNEYVQIQGELNKAESDETVFMVRMGSNISNKEGGGNISYNSVTKQIDVNIGSDGEWTTMQRVGHEFKHVDQFINLELDLTLDGKGGLLYDKTDEISAYRRQNFLGEKEVDPIKTVNDNSSTRRERPKSFHLLDPPEQNQYETLNYIYHWEESRAMYSHDGRRFSPLPRANLFVSSVIYGEVESYGGKRDL
jgi:RHS repeat-associated protein